MILPVRTPVGVGHFRLIDLLPLTLAFFALARVQLDWSLRQTGSVRVG